VLADPGQVEQVLLNLAVNARDAMPAGGTLILETDNVVLDETFTREHPSLLPGPHVLLAVSDTGTGIPREIREHIFEPFFSTKEAGKGTGLGLATVYGIVKQNEGFINVYSEPGRGTTFKIYLPRFKGQTSEATSESLLEAPPGRGETVLLVEDDPVILGVGRTMLEKLGYTVLAAGTPGEAVSQAKSHAAELQLLITDVVMPEMNGRDLAELLKATKPGLKCLFSSGYTANVIAHSGVLDEGVHFLQKPFSLKTLATKVREALEGM
jgi:CheY-like chemotaxis protein